MVYKWKIDKLYPVKAQEAGEELDRIYAKYGEISPEQIVNESRDEKAPLHCCFEWDDAKAAEKYRQKQAQGLMNAITVSIEEAGARNELRAFVHVQSTYQPLRIVMNDEAKMQELLAGAMRELRLFRAKYSSLEQLAGVITEIDRLAG